MGTTANKGLPYPGSSDLVTNGAAAIQALAEAIDMPYAHRSTSAAPSIPNNALTNVLFPTSEGMSTGATYDAGTGAITVTETGRYDICGQIRFNTNATGRRAVSVLRNGATALIDAETTPNAASLVSVPFCKLGVSLNAGDTVTVQAFQSSGAALGLVGGPTSNYVSVVGR